MALRDDLQHWKEIGGRIWRQKFWEYVFKEDHRSGSQPSDRGAKTYSSGLLKSHREAEGGNNGSHSKVKPHWEWNITQGLEDYSEYHLVICSLCSRWLFLLGFPFLPSNLSWNLRAMSQSFKVSFTVL